jgi:hypothetical protein
MSDVDRLLWQTEFFISMSTKVRDPSLAEMLQRAAETYLTEASETVRRQRADRQEDPARARKGSPTG